MAGTLTPAQGRGHKGHSAIDQATQQVIEMELITMNQRPALDLFLDARWCFDLMVEACHNMVCRQHGAADDYLHLHAQTHRSMKYYVRHKYGSTRITIHLISTHGMVQVKVRPTRPFDTLLCQIR